MQADEQAIRELVATWLSASKAGDVKTVLRLMSEDVVFLVAGQPPMRGKGAFAAALTGFKPFQFEATSEIQEIKILGDWAYLWTTLTVVVTPKEGAPAITRSGTTLSILHKQASGWVIVRDANMLAVQSQ